MLHVLQNAPFVTALVGMWATGCGVAGYEVENAKVFGVATDVHDLAANSYVSVRSTEALSGLELEVSGDCAAGVTVDPQDETRATIQASATFLDLDHLGSGSCQLSSREERFDGDSRSFDVYEVQRVKTVAVSDPARRDGENAFPVGEAAVFSGATIQVTALYGSDADINTGRTYALNGFGLEAWSIIGATTVGSDPHRRLQDVVATDAASVTITASVPGAIDEPLRLEVVPLESIARLRWITIDGVYSLWPNITAIELMPVTEENVLILGDVEYAVEATGTGELLVTGTGRSFDVAPIRAHLADRRSGEFRLRVAGHVELLRIVLED